ncbi:AarF/ABC1/UbiB kinase family protein [Conexibacter sp. DBS9H8]|uniref:ABC1 kinase family protein n=1 Tax=Conexibacter sp. DBS9H8 TaxID=2937801 RepID=UPI00200E8107|nr:AarF/ABC1/UbiB kinase family protein [Conexibacter sp. DBS9H8]
MSDLPDHTRSEARRIPSGRIARTARVGGLAAGQGVRWAGMRAANRVRSPERAEAAERVRTVALVNELVDQLSRMRGAAMKVGQMLSMVEFDGLEPDQREELSRRLATLRDDVAPVPFARLERLMVSEFGAPLAQVFSEFDERAFAAASIGQVHRARTRAGVDVVVKVQYPGVAEAVDTDLRNAKLLVPLLSRLAPGLDARALADELAERIAEELDYELEAQHQRRIGRLFRGHPFIVVPAVDTALSTRRVLVSDYLDGERFSAVQARGQADRDRYAEIVFRFFFGLLYRDRIALGDPHPGNYLRLPDGRVGFLDFGLLREVTPDRVRAEAAIAAAVAAADADALTEALIGAGYLPRERAGSVDGALLLGLLRRATGWYAVPGMAARTGAPDPDEVPGDRDLVDPLETGGRIPATAARREAIRHQIRQLTLPPEVALIRRMHRLVALVLENLDAHGDWGAIAAEYLHGAAPATPLGDEEAPVVLRRRGAGFPPHPCGPPAADLPPGTGDLRA